MRKHKAVNRPVLNVEIGDLGVVDLLDDKEVIWLVLSPIRAFPVPISRTIALNDILSPPPRGTSDGDVGTRDDDGIKSLS